MYDFLPNSRIQGIYRAECRFFRNNVFPAYSGSHGIPKGHTRSYGSRPYSPLFVFETHLHLVWVYVYVHVLVIHAYVQHVKRKLAHHDTGIEGPLYAVGDLLRTHIAGVYIQRLLLPVWAGYALGAYISGYPEPAIVVVYFFNMRQNLSAVYAEYCRTQLPVTGAVVYYLAVVQ